MSFPLVYAILNVDSTENAVLSGKKFIEAEVPLLQIRAKNLIDREFVTLSRALIEFRNSVQARSKILINDRADICLLSQADGVHLGQEDLPPPLVRDMIGDRLLGFSTHTREQFLGAPIECLDYVALGPIFPSSTKTGHAEVIGLSELSRMVPEKKRPLVAIGGIHLENAEDVYSAGADSVAMVSAFHEAESISQLLSDLEQKYANSVRV